MYFIHIIKKKEKMKQLVLILCLQGMEKQKY